MKSFSITIPALLAALASATPTIYMAGDSTMAKGGGGSGTQGWGEYFPFSVKGATVVNAAIAGRSARSYTDEGRFASLIEKVVPGDFVMVEFGHNDGGSASGGVDNGRSPCPGDGNETCTTSTGRTVLTYVTYLTNAARSLVDKGAQVIISSPTPSNICGGTLNCAYSSPRFTAYGQKAASNVGTGASFIDHGLYLAHEYQRLGKEKVNSFYPVDNTHTSPDGAEVVAQTYVKAVLCNSGVLAPLIKDTTASLPGDCA